MKDRISTSYTTLLGKIIGDGLLDEAEVARLKRLIDCGDAQTVGFAAHELIRRLVGTGRLLLRRGRLDRTGMEITAADHRRGHLYTLPDLIAPGNPSVRTPLDPSLGPPPSFSDEEITRLFQDQSRKSLSSVERSADIKGVVTDILDLVRKTVDVPAAVCFTHTLPIPSGIGRGLGRLTWGLVGKGQGPGTSPETLGGPVQISSRLSETWKPWVEAAGRNPGSALYLPDLALLEDSRRPLAKGSALLIPLFERHPSWEAVLIAVARRAFWFDQERIARLRLFAPHFRRQFTYAVLLQTVISHDFLTSIYNRSFFEDQMTRALAGATRMDQTFCLLIIDIDDFKGFNTRFGYDAGDEVLKSVAATLKRALRTTDVLARYGGEEFAAILPAPVSRREVDRIAERLRAAVEDQEIEIPTLSRRGARGRVRVSVSIGGALFPESGQGRDELWSEANRMLLAAKQTGKNQVRLPWSGSGGERLEVIS